jgi:hypothetical protein
VQRRGDKSRILLDWFTVSYRDIAIVIGILFALLVAALLIWYFVFYESPPAEQALQAIRTAESSLNKAFRAAKDHPGLGEGLNRAREELTHAQELYRREIYREAIAHALTSSRISDEISMQAESGPHVATVMEPVGSVEVKRGASPRWQGAREDMPLYVGDQVRAGPNSSAWIHYLNGTVVEVGPRSHHLVVDYTRTSLELSVSRGEAIVETAENTETKIHTPRADARIEGADRVRVGVDEEGGSAEFASELGRTTIETPDGREEPLGPFEGRVVDDSGRKPFLWLKPPQLLEPPDGRIFAITDPAQETIQLVWSKVPGAVEYIVEIMEARRGGRRLSQEVSETSADLVPPDIGSYLWRVIARAADGPSSLPSEKRRFRVRDAAQVVGQPPELTVKRFPMRFGTKVLLEGEVSAGAILTYSVNGEREISMEASEEDGKFTFKEMILLTRAGRNEIVVRAQSVTGAETIETIPVDYEGP